MPEVVSKILLILLVIFQLSSSNRRIKGGLDITSDKKYAVYLLRAPDAPVKTQGWTCGGAIVTKNFVITAAACVDNMERIYVIAGYKKFVTSAELDRDTCTSKMRKRVTFTCLPKEYDLKYKTVEGWSRIDIAAVKVDTPFDFEDLMYEQYCSYIPTSIDINYWPKFQNPGKDSLVMGWGHLQQYKEDFDLNNYNVDSIKYTPTKILDKEKCLTYFPHNQKMHPIIKEYMICTLEAGNLNDKGQLILRTPVKYSQGCISKKDQAMGMIGRTCEGQETEVADTRKKFNNGSRKYGDDSNSGVVPDFTKIFDETLRVFEHNSQKAKDAPGICQNDHGGPLVTWEGRHEILIGVATLFKLDDESNCMGPYLFTSTFCTGAFLRCILSMENNTDTSRRCKNAKGQVFGVAQRRISWDDKNEGSAAVKKELIRIQKRPQIPVSAFYSKL